MKRVLVLSGGGAKGAMQIGCAAELYLKGRRWDAVVGVSAGALNAAGIGFFNPVESLKFWKKIKKNSDVLSQNWISLLWRSGLYSMKPLEKFLKDTFNNVQGPWLDFYMGITNIKTGKIRFELGKNDASLVKYLIASSCIPTIMEHKDFEADGGIRDTVPLSFAIKDLGADEIDIIMCQSIDRNQWFDSDAWKPSWPYIVSSGIRTVDILSSEVTHGDIKLCQARNSDPNYKRVAVQIYAPNTPPPIDALDFNGAKIEAAIEYGKTMAAQPSLRFGYDQ